MSGLYLEIDRTTKACKAQLSGNIKFPADTFIYENDRYYLICNGINFTFKSTNKKVNADIIIGLYQKHTEGFINNLRGSFSGALFDKLNNKWIIYTNQVGDQKLFYFLDSKKIIISSNIFEITHSLKKNGVNISLDINSAYSLLSLGYLPYNSTVINEIKRLHHGTYMVYDNEKQPVIKQYYMPDNQSILKIKPREIIEEIDRLFTKAVALEFDKDKLYGLEHLSAMSGGLDCRMTNWVANKLGYTPITNFTFSQYGYLDMTLARQMSAHLGHEWFFKSLDNGNFLKYTDELVYKTNGAEIYFGAAHSFSTMRLINSHIFGLSHGGQLGDVLLGTYCPQNAYAKPIKVKATSNKLLNKVKIDFGQYPNNEIAHICIRGFNGILAGNFVCQPFTEVASPFLDIDFMDFALKIPVELRAYQHIYRKWILEKHPDAAKFKWESINAKITDRKVIIRGKEVPLKQLGGFFVKSAQHYMGLKNIVTRQKSMNPFQYWYATNPSLKNYINTYYCEGISLIDNKELANDCKILFNTGSVTEKMQVLTLISVIKQLGL